MKKFGIVGLFLILFSLFPATTAAAASYQQQLTKALRTQISYELPYPGILPDNILYSLKAFRDQLISFFVADPVKKTEFDLLQADKRLAASRALFAKGGEDRLVSETASKGENYFAQAVTSIARAKQEGILVNGMLDTLTTASIKHQQVLYEMMRSSHGQLRADLQEDIQRVQQFENQVNKLKTQK